MNKPLGHGWFLFFCEKIIRSLEEDRKKMRMKEAAVEKGILGGARELEKKSKIYGTTRKRDMKK